MFKRQGTSRINLINEIFSQPLEDMILFGTYYRM